MDAFGVVFDGDFLVAILRYLHPFERFQISDMRHKRHYLIADPGETVIHWFRIRVKIDEDEAMHDIHPNRTVADFAFVKARIFNTSLRGSGILKPNSKMYPHLALT